MLNRNALILALAALTSVLALPSAHPADAAAKDPATGKDCVAYFSSETSDAGQTRMNYRNICPTPFTIRIKTGEGVRKKSIEAGSADKPSKAYVTCRSTDRCESSEWVYE